MRLLLDEHLSTTVAEELRRRGHDVVGATEVGLRQQPDSALFAWAVREGRAIATANYQDFRPLHELYLSRGEGHLGLILIPRRVSLAKPGFGRLIEGLDRFLRDRPGPEGLASGEAWLSP